MKEFGGIFGIWLVIFIVAAIGAYSCTNSCENIGKKTARDNPTRDELEWYAKNCLGR